MQKAPSLGRKHETYTIFKTNSGNSEINTLSFSELVRMCASVYVQHM